MKTILNGLSALCLLSGCLAVPSWPAGCGNFQSESNFNATKYDGRWYVLGTYSTLPNFAPISCGYVDINFKEGGKIQEDLQLLYEGATALIGASLNFTLQDSPKPVWFVNTPEDTGVLVYEWVFKTDYDYAFMYRCNPARDQQSQDEHSALVITKQKNPSESYRNEVEQRFRESDGNEWVASSRLNPATCETFLHTTNTQA